MRAGARIAVVRGEGEGMRSMDGEGGCHTRLRKGGTRDGLLVGGESANLGGGGPRSHRVEQNETTQKILILIDYVVLRVQRSLLKDSFLPQQWRSLSFFSPCQFFSRLPCGGAIPHLVLNTLERGTIPPLPPPPPLSLPSHLDAGDEARRRLLRG